MQDRLTRMAMVVIAVLLAFLVAQPYVNRYLFSAREPRVPAPRGDLSEFERSTIRVFETVAPSVLQVAALPRGGMRLQGSGPASSGTGFVWDAAGHVVTNDHVVGEGNALAVRLASGEVPPGEIVGRAAN
jgi:2-alkenal reductase